MRIRGALSQPSELAETSLPFCMPPWVLLKIRLFEN